MGSENLGYTYIHGPFNIKLKSKPMHYFFFWGGPFSEQVTIFHFEHRVYFALTTYGIIARFSAASGRDHQYRPSIFMIMWHKYIIYVDFQQMLRRVSTEWTQECFMKEGVKMDGIKVQRIAEMWWDYAYTKPACKNFVLENHACKAFSICKET